MSTTQNYRLPVARTPSPPPAPLWQQAAPVVARGVALVAAGVIGEWMVRSATRKVVSLPFNRPKQSKALTKPNDVVSYSETIIVQRSVTRRR